MASSPPPNQLYQYSLINALMAGVANSGLTVEKYLTKGNQGIGTFQNIKGELVLLDDKVYQLQASGEIRVAEKDEQLPYAVATHFVADQTYDVELSSKNGIDEVLDKFDDQSKNLFMSYRVDGTFKHIKARTVRGQEYEGQPLSELGDKQAVQEYDSIRGTVVGFRAPEAWQGFMVAGEHMHFIDDDRKVGGHILELVSDGKVHVAVAECSDVHIELPKSNEFRKANMTTDDKGVKGIEG